MLVSRFPDVGEILFLADAFRLRSKRLGAYFFGIVLYAGIAISRFRLDFVLAHAFRTRSKRLGAHFLRNC